MVQQRQGGKGGRRQRTREPRRTSEFIEKVVHVNRCAKVVKGGRRFSFSALVVVGDGKGKVGYGFGKANEVADAIKKGIDAGKRAMVHVILSGSTIPHEVMGTYSACRVMLKPAAPGTGVIAGGGVRAVLEAVGVKDILTKSLRSANLMNVVKASMQGLLSLNDRRSIMEARGLLAPALKQETVSAAVGEGQTDGFIETD
jgi:small subunit ribosomal protein S5